MSTLEKLLVLGVLVLVGVILAISLFWSRPDVNNPGTRSHMSSVTLNPTNQTGDNAPPALNPPRLDGNNNNANPANVNNNGAVVNNAAMPESAPASKPAERPLLLSRPVPSAFVTASPNPSFYVYKVQKGDTPRSVSFKLTGTDANARSIDKAVEGQPLVPGKEILVPADIFNNMKTPAGEVANNNVEPIKTGPNTSKASVNAHESKGASDATNPKSDAGSDVASSMYTVKRGDSLRKIARVTLKDERRWKEIQQLNQMKSDVVREGQKIKLPSTNP